MGAIGPSRGKRSFYFANRPDRMWGATASYLFGAGSLRQSGRSVYLTAHLNQESSLRTNGAIPLPPLHMASLHEQGQFFRWNSCF